MPIDGAISRRQSQVSTSGAAWQNHVKNFVNSKMTSTDMKIIDGNEAKKKPELARVLSITVPGQAESSWGDIDLVLVKKVDGQLRPLAVISCKTSIRERITQTLFYSVLLKGKVKFFLATKDPDWGTREKPNKRRQLSRGFLDGVYVEDNKVTKFGDIVKKLSDLSTDILNLF